MDLIPATQTAADKSNPAWNKRSSRTWGTVENRHRQQNHSGGFREWTGEGKDAEEFIY